MKIILVLILVVLNFIIWGKNSVVPTPNFVSQTYPVGGYQLTGHLQDASVRLQNACGIECLEN